MDIINYFQIPRGARIELFNKKVIKDAVSYASLPYSAFSEYGHLSPHDVENFLNEFGSSDLLVVNRSKDKPGTIQQCFIDEKGNLVKRNYVVKPSATLGPHSEVVRDSAGNITHTLINSQGKTQTYKWGNPLAIRADRIFLEGRAGALQKFAMDLERPGLRRIAGFIFKLAEKIR